MGNFSAQTYEKLLEFNSLIFKDIKNLPYNILNALDTVFNYKLTAYSIFEKDTKVYPIKIIGPNLDQNMLKTHKTEDVYQHDIFAKGIPKKVHKSNRNVYIVQDFMSMEEFRETIYGKRLSSFNLYAQAVLYTSNAEFPRHAVNIFKTFEQGDFTQEEVDLLDKIGEIFMTAAPLYKQFIDQQSSIGLIENFCNNISYSFAIITNAKKIIYYNESFINHAQILIGQDDVDFVFNDLLNLLEDSIKSSLGNLIRPMTVDLDNCKVIITPHTIVCDEYVRRYLFLTIFERDEDEDAYNKDKPKISVYNMNFLKKYNLTRRELEILQLMLEGYSNQQIADIQYISIFTVKTHNKNIFRKLKVSTRMEAVAKLKELQ